MNTLTIFPKSPTVHRQPGEPIEFLLARFKKGVQKAGIVREMRRHEHFVKPSERDRQKRFAARRRRNGQGVT